MLVDVVVRKARTLMRDPLAVSSSKVRKLASALARAQLARSGARDALRLRPADAIPPDALDLLTLYRAVRKRKPRLVLELGAGCSTPILAQAVADNGFGRILSIDGDERWAKEAAAIIPPALQSVCDVLYRPVRIELLRGERVLRQDIPDVVPEFIYLDGPAPLDGVSISGDVLALEPKLDVGAFILVDGRADNVAFLRAQLSPGWRFKHSRVRQSSTFERVRRG